MPWIRAHGSTSLAPAACIAHPSFPRPCTPQSCPFDDTDGQYEPGISDVGLCFLDEPVLGIRPAKLANRSLDDERVPGTRMTIVGYGTTAPAPGGPADTSLYDGIRRWGTSTVDQVIDQNWVTFNRDPVGVCYGTRAHRPSSTAEWSRSHPMAPSIVCLPTIAPGWTARKCAIGSSRRSISASRFDLIGVSGSVTETRWKEFIGAGDRTSGSPSPRAHTRPRGRSTWRWESGSDMERPLGSSFFFAFRRAVVRSVIVAGCDDSRCGLRASHADTRTRPHRDPGDRGRDLPVRT